MHRAHSDFLFDITITTRAIDFTRVLLMWAGHPLVTDTSSQLSSINKESREWDHVVPLSAGQLIHQSMAQTTHAVLVQAACSEARQALQDAREREKAVPQCRSRRFRHFELRGLND